MRLQQLVDDVRSAADDGVELRKIVTTQAVVGDVGFVAKIRQRLDPGPEVLSSNPSADPSPDPSTPVLRRERAWSAQRGGGMAGSVVMFDGVLAAMHRAGCRFVVIGSVARALAGEDVVAHDLDIMIDASTDGRRRLRRALADVGATVETRIGRRRIEQCVVLSWEWGFRASTAAGQVDVITRLIDGTTIDDHDAHAITVELSRGCSVRIHPTRHAEAA